MNLLSDLLFFTITKISYDKQDPGEGFLFIELCMLTISAIEFKDSTLRYFYVFSVFWNNCRNNRILDKISLIFI